MSSAEVDIRAVKTLIALLGSEKVGDHLRAFCARVEELLPGLTEAVGRGALDEVCRTAHDLNSTAGHLGFIGFSRLAHRVERAARGGDRELALSEARELAPGYALARVSLYGHFPDLVPVGDEA